MIFRWDWFWRLFGVDRGTKVESGSNKCGCGRSPNGYCMGLHALSDEEWAAYQNDGKPVTAPKKVRTPKAAGPKKERATKAERKAPVEKAPVEKAPKSGRAKEAPVAVEAVKAPEPKKVRAPKKPKA